MVNVPEYSIIIPVYNAESSIAELIERIIKVFKNITINFEIILIDDYSKDNSWDELKKIYQSNENVKIIHLMKNYGQHNATLCGFKYSNGEYVITLDDDLQNIPEEIPLLLDATKKGYKVVFGRYTTKKTDIITKILSHIFQILIQKMCDIPKTITTSSFSVYHKDVVKNMTEIKSAFPFLPALISKSVSPTKITNVEVSHNPRKCGKSNYTFMKYFIFSLNLIINHSILPLIIIGFIGMIISLLSFLYGLLIIYSYLVNPLYGLVGWTSTMVILTFLGGMTLLSVAIIGEYLRRILVEVSYAPPYVIAEMEC